MPAYNFKPQFADAILAGLKLQTIRKPRKRPTVPGDVLTLYTGQRTKACRLLARVRVVEVAPVKFDREWTTFADDKPIWFSTVTVGDKRLDAFELAALAQRDGFRDTMDFLAFFTEHYNWGREGGPDVLEVELIRWELL